MSVHVYGINHVAIEVTDIEKAVAFYTDVFGLKKKDEGEGDAFFKIGEHQFLAMFEVEKMMPDRTRHFGIIVRDEREIKAVREKVADKYGLPFPLVADTARRVATAYGVLRPSGRARRVTFLIDAAGTVVEVVDQSPADPHVAAVRRRYLS